MAIRTIREWPDELLKKTCKPVKEMTPRLKELVQDMIETMHEASGVGLAAPQVGILKRIFVVDISEEGNEPYVCVNPEILEKEGEQFDYEGCLSLPGYSGKVRRAERIRLRAFDENMKPFEVEAEGLLARAFQHEYDHLEGIMYTEEMEGELVRNEDLAKQEVEG